MIVKVMRTRHMRSSDRMRLQVKHTRLSRTSLVMTSGCMLIWLTRTLTKGVVSLATTSASKLWNPSVFWD